MLKRKLSEIFPSKENTNFKEYQLIRAQCQQAKNEKDFETAFKLAQQAAARFRTPGFILLHEVNYAKAVDKSLSEDSQKNFLLESSINFNLARLFTPDSDPELLQTCKWQISEEKLRKFVEEADENFQFDENDENYVTEQTKERFAAIKQEILKLKSDDNKKNLEEIEQHLQEYFEDENPISEPVDSADMHP